MNGVLSLMFLAGTLMGSASGYNERVVCDATTETMYGYSANDLVTNTPITFDAYAGKVRFHSYLNYGKLNIDQ